MKQMNNNGEKLFDMIFINVVDDEEDEELFIDEISHEIYRKFHEFIDNEKGRKVKRELTKNTFERVEEKNKSFFENKYNIIYLKLLSLYSKITKNKKEDESLYYVISKFAFSPETLKIVSKIIADFRKIEDTDVSKIVELFTKEVSVSQTILKPYNDAKKYGEDLYIKYKDLEDNDDEDLDYGRYRDSEFIEETINVIEEVIDYPYFEVLKDNSKDYLEEEISPKITISDLANAYCHKYGNEFTEEERKILQSELSEKETKYLTSSIKRSSR